MLMNAVKTNYVFKRVEKKYLLTANVYEDLILRLAPFIERDSYGLHTICNIYYDTERYDLIRNSIEKPKYKEKLRLRSYGIPTADSRVFLEIKKKYKGTVFKRREEMTLFETQELLENGSFPEKKSQILNEIEYFLKFYHPEPKLFLAYDREAYSGKEDSSLRITFDRNIRSRTTELT
jgi:SPX domain protein involved in polyphosphate accumulation